MKFTEECNVLVLRYWMYVYYEVYLSVLLDYIQSAYEYVTTLFIETNLGVPKRLIFQNPILCIWSLVTKEIN